MPNSPLKIIVNLSQPLQIETCETAIQVTGGKSHDQIVRRCFSSKQGKHRIICGHQCLVVTWSFMDQLFPFWFNSPCDWFSVHYCWKISTLNRAWNRESFEYRCFRLRPCHWKTLGTRRQLQVDYVASDKSCNSFCTRQRYLHLNAYSRNLNSIKTDCKCQLLGCTRE